MALGGCCLYGFNGLCGILGEWGAGGEGREREIALLGLRIAIPTTYVACI